MRVLAALVALLLASLPALARATLADDAAAIEALGETNKLTLLAKQTAFLEEGQVLAVPKSDAERCRTVVLLAARPIAFSTVAGSADDDLDELMAMFADKDSPHRQAAEAGLIVLSGCDSAARALDTVLLRMAAPRATVELRVFGGDDVLSNIDAAVGRIAGPPAPRGDPGPPLPVQALSVRREAAEQRARADGATNVLLLEAKAGVAGTGELAIKVPKGCHRFDVMAEAPEGHPGLDLDAELRDGDTTLRVSRDRGEAPDARVEACVGRTTELSLVFAGAPSGARVVVHDALFPVPEGVPGHWGPRGEAGLVAGLRRRLKRGPDRAPVFESLGAQGSTKATMPVEPGRCYVAVATLLRGSSRGMRLVASASARASYEEVPPSEEGAAVVFCSVTNNRAELSVDVPGSSIGWLLAVWALGSGSAGAGE